MEKLIIGYYQRLWDQIHSKAANAVTFEQKAEYSRWVRQLVTTMNCPHCRIHGTEYIQIHPPESAGDLFYWSWEFHNNVNGRLGKPIMSYEDATMKHKGWS